MKGIITFVLFYYIKTIVGQESCQQFPIPDNIYFNETSAAGSIIFVSNETNSTKQDWTIATNTRVALTLVNQTYQITLLTAVDLDVTDPSDTCVSGFEQFMQTITCARTAGKEPITKTVTFHVLSVNEYPPDVNTVPDIQITEGNDTLPFYLASLLDSFKDRDCPKVHLVLSISDYSSNERDASQYFMINSSTGYLYQVKHFDYEDTDIQCGLGKGGGFLNITAEDGVHKTSKILSVTFVDVDDSPPVFVNSQCSTTCYINICPVSSLVANIHFSDQGTVPTNPASIKALDPDTNSTNITYSMEVHPENYRDNIQFDNGTFILLQSFANFSGYAEDSDFTVTVTMQATGSNGQMSDNLTLSINVNVPPTTTTTTATTTTTTTTTTPSTTTKEVTSSTTAPPTTTTPAPERDANSDTSDDNKVLVIVLAVIGGVVVLILIVVVYKVRTKQPQQKYNLKDTKGFNGTAANGGAPEKEMTADNPVFDGEKENV